jgi:tetratricopeptide (TPR) repeat protein
MKPTRYSVTAVLLSAVLTAAAPAAFPQAPASRAQALAALKHADAAQGLWLLWSRSGDAALDRLMAHGVDEMQAARYQQAIATFSEVIKKKPEFAEAWNKRATVYFLAGEHRKSIADCQEVLKRNPRHFGALSGMGQIHLQLDEPGAALVWFRRALEVNPNLLGVEMNIEALERLLKDKPGRST